MNTPRSISVGELLRQAESYHEQYMKTLQSILEVTSNGSHAPQSSYGARMERASSHDSATISVTPYRGITFEARQPMRAMGAGSDGHAFPQELLRKNRRLSTEKKQPEILPHPAHRPVSVFAPDIDSEEDVEFLQLTAPDPNAEPHVDTYGGDDPTKEHLSLPHESFTLEQLVGHLKGLKEDNKVLAEALGSDLWQKRAELDPHNVVDEGDTDINPTYEVYDINHDGVAVQRLHQKSNEADGESATVAAWETLKEVSSEGAAGGIFGRITVFQEPSPLMLGAAHMTMAKHFDMDELFRHLITADGNMGKTRAYVDRAFEPTEIHRRTFFFVFKYYTVVEERLRSAPWQKFDYRPPDRRSKDHIDITECSSVLALSLDGEPIERLTRKHGRHRKKPDEGYVYNPFAPWHLLSIQSFPDESHSFRGDDLNKQFVSGPYAFLDTLAAEYRDAVKRYARLNKMITQLITPPSEFMFDAKLRDKLLFEDKDFTYSRRYFWAYNTLGVINDGIKSMRAAYTDTFGDDFWEGRNKTIWPYPYIDTALKAAYEKLMLTVRHDLEKAVTELKTMELKNNQTRDEIFSLREQLFSGSSVRESRRAIEQGDNIKILTGVSMLFLPLTFVTSVFGITTLDIPASDWRFPATMVTVCVPFFILIFFLQTRVGMDVLRQVGKRLDKLMRPYFGPADRHQRYYSQDSPGVGTGVDDGSYRQGGDIRRKRRRKGLRRAQAEIPSINGGGRLEKDTAASKWLRGFWTKQKAGRDFKDGDV